MPQASAFDKDNRSMKVIEAIIERAKDGTYSVYCLHKPFSGMGDTPEAAKANMIEAMQFHKEGCMADGSAYPGFLDDEFEVVYLNFTPDRSSKTCQV